MASGRRFADLPGRRIVHNMVIARDASTGLILRKNGSICRTCCDSIEYGADCEYCQAGTTPKYINVFIDGLIDCDCVHLKGNYETWYTYEIVSNIATQINGSKYVLEQYKYNECLWRSFYDLTTPVQVGSFVGSFPRTCPLPYFHAIETYNKFYIEVFRWASVLTVRLHITDPSYYVGADTLTVFSAEIDLNEVNKCVNSNNATVTQTSNCYIDDLNYIGWLGLADIGVVAVWADDLCQGVAAWSSALTYSINDFATYAGGCYVSLTNNINKQPNTNPSDWKLVE